jgi:ADP-ribose pyrophosphatase YjhB (NUDIX family)
LRSFSGTSIFILVPDNILCSMLMERPDERRWRDVVNAYGRPVLVDTGRCVQVGPEDADLRTGSEEVVLTIFNLAGSCIFVRRNDRSDWSLPMGRIGKGEGIIEAACRHALEAVGATIVPLGVPMCQIVTASCRGEAFQRWLFVVVAETATSALDPRDSARGDQAKFFDIPPPDGRRELMEWMAEIHREGMRFLRSMDALDGI